MTCAHFERVTRIGPFGPGPCTDSCSPRPPTSRLRTHPQNHISVERRVTRAQGTVPGHWSVPWILASGFSAPALCATCSCGDTATAMGRWEGPSKRGGSPWSTLLLSLSPQAVQRPCRTAGGWFTPTETAEARGPQSLFHLQIPWHALAKLFLQRAWDVPAELSKGQYVSRTPNSKWDF